MPNLVIRCTSTSNVGGCYPVDMLGADAGAMVETVLWLRTRVDGSGNDSCKMGLCMSER